MNLKKYILKPGRHQFVPGEHARHNNDNLTDAEAKWYLERYPHIAKLFINSSDTRKTEGLEYKQTSGKRKRIGVVTPKSVKSQTNENLSTTN